jgi:glucose/mannose transport system permease protein
MKLKQIVLYGALIFFTFVYLLPLWSTITTSLKTPEAVASTSPLMFPKHPTLAPFAEAFNGLKIPLLNSILITAGGVAGSVFLGSICGYIFSKIRFKHDNLVFLILAVGAFIPYQSVLVPLFITISHLGLFGTIPGLILTHTAYGIPMCTILFRNFYGAIPESIINQARIDGAGDWRIYRRIILPTTILATIVVVTFQFTSIWNEFLFGLLLGGGEGQAMPATVALNNLKGTYTALWNVQMAGAVWVALPVLILYIILGRYLIRGYMAGAVKA